MDSKYITSTGATITRFNYTGANNAVETMDMRILYC
jgi:hypothetical protein